jgi:pimeloyl-ACP methyl ester carboxylesterase
MKDSLVMVGGGRQLSYTDIGDPDGPCIFFFHGAPTSRLQLVGLDEQLAARGLRVVSPDRPSYGKSSPQPNRSITDWPSDVVALADALAVDRFIVAGHSSGGPYAVACAALLPDRVSAGLVIAGVTDMGWPGAWEGYIESEIELMRMKEENDLVAWCAEHFGADGSEFLAASGFELPEPDNALLADENAEAALESNVAEAFRQGVAGYAQDIFIQGRAWPFDPGSIAVCVEVVHGESDTLVPLAHSRHTAELITGSRFRPLAGHGHLTILSEFPGLASALVSLRG